MHATLPVDPNQAPVTTKHPFASHSWSFCSQPGLHSQLSLALTASAVSLQATHHHDAHLLRFRTFDDVRRCLPGKTQDMQLDGWLG
jgi:hypothetical protein